jgi:hypothetical protein
MVLKSFRNKVTVLFDISLLLFKVFLFKNLLKNYFKKIYF